MKHNRTNCAPHPECPEVIFLGESPLLRHGARGWYIYKEALQSWSFPVPRTISIPAHILLLFEIVVQSALQYMLCKQCPEFGDCHSHLFEVSGGAVESLSPAHQCVTSTTQLLRALHSYCLIA